MTVTFRDLWLRRMRKARAAKFRMVHNRNRELWDQFLIEWVKIAPQSLARQRQDYMAKDPLRRELAKRNRLRALKFRS